MRILFVTAALEPYGATRSMVALIKSLKQHHDVESVVLIRHSAIPVADFLKNQGVAYKRFGFLPNVTPIPDANNLVSQNALRLKNWAYCLRNNLINYARAFLFRGDFSGFDIIHSNNSVTNFGIYLSLSLSVPHVQHFREFGAEDYSIQRCPVIRNEKKWHSLPKASICLSKSLQKNLIEKQTIESQNVSVIYTPFDEPKFTNLVSINELSPIRFGMPGRQFSGKNQLDAIVAFGKLLSMDWRGPPELHFWGDGPEEYKRSLRDLVQELEISEQVVFHEFSNNLSVDLLGVDVGLNCSTSEVFSRASMEMLIQGIPLLASRSGGNPEQVEHGVTGFLYSPSNTDELAHFMRTLATDKKLVRKMSQQAHSINHRRFTSLSSSGKTAEIYSNLLTRKSLGGP